ncbi:SIS domain-containing protein [Myxococcus sp. SDU36]|uniref:D-sedoheptulose-7-phosphate isomerase n=1 Tax=Myxococcus sp. SDU36 TaxID=2831967 RepID=UPI0025431C66|nr:SIS domain-containing protein [Myxococcus sp. SDU36]WIG98777.1 SIS domain-containing protein [Myxococcus sp. SDU36]
METALKAVEDRSEPGTRLVRQHVQGSIDTKQRLLEHCEQDIQAAAHLLAQALQSGGKVLLCGNGGSAADCQHLAAEFVSALSHDLVRPGLAAIALTTDTSLITAHANDFGFSHIFERQVQALGRPGDVLLGISTSGESENVVRAFRCARLLGIRTLALTGSGGGKLLGLSDVCIRVPSGNVQHIQECHITLAHVLCMLVEREWAVLADAGTDWSARHEK